jgi:fibronectin-binding autotransporter adhesin
VATILQPEIGPATQRDAADLTYKSKGNRTRGVTQSSCRIQVSRATHALRTRFWRAFIFTLFPLIFCIPHSTEALTKTWDAGSTTGDWNLQNNWNLNVLPGVADDVLFDNSVESPLEDIYLAASQSINSVTINLTAGPNQNWNLGADKSTSPFTLTLASGNISVLSTSGTGTYVIGATTGTNIGTGILTLATTGAGFTFNEARSNGGLLQINAIVSGASKNVTKTGVGEVILSGINTYTGVTTISAGTLNVATIGNGGVAGNLGQATSAAGNLVFDGGELDYTGLSASTDRNFTINPGKDANFDIAANTLTISGASTGTTGSLTKNGAGTLILSGANAYTGATKVAAGVLNIQNPTGLGTIAGGTTVSDGATLQLQNNITVGAEALTISGVGASGQNGALVNVSGTNNYGGLLTLAAASTISSNSGTFNLTNTGTITGATFGLTLSGSGDGNLTSIIGTTSGTLSKTGTGTWTLKGANTFSGNTVISAGVLNIQNSSALGSTTGGTSVLSGAALQIQGSITVGENLILGGTGIANDGALRNINGTNTINGSITLNLATLFRSDAGTLALGGNVDNGGNGNSFTFDGAGNISIAGVVSGDGALTKNGTGTLSLDGSNTYSGTTTINAGKLTMATDSGLGAIGASLIINGGTLELTGTSITGRSITLGSASSTIQVDASQSYTSTTAIGGTGTLNKDGAGTLVLSGANSYGGGTFINSGTLAINNSLSLGLTSGPLTINDGTLRVLTGFTSARKIIVDHVASPPHPPEARWEVRAVLP